MLADLDLLLVWMVSSKGSEGPECVPEGLVCPGAGCAFQGQKALKLRRTAAQNGGKGPEKVPVWKLPGLLAVSKLF